MSDDLHIKEPNYLWAKIILTVAWAGFLAYLALANWIWGA